MLKKCPGNYCLFSVWGMEVINDPSVLLYQRTLMLASHTYITENLSLSQHIVFCVLYCRSNVLFYKVYNRHTSSLEKLRKKYLTCLISVYRNSEISAESSWISLWGLYVSYKPLESKRKLSQRWQDNLQTLYSLYIWIKDTLFQLVLVYPDKERPQWFLCLRKCLSS